MSALLGRHTMGDFYANALDSNTMSSSGILNMGYWAEGTRDLRNAQCMMFELIHDLVGFGRSGIRVWEFGVGYGRHYAHWQDLGFHEHDRVVGFDITPRQIEGANAFIRENGDLGTHAGVFEHSATELASIDRADHGTPDVILSIEAPFHFDTRDAFLRQAFEALPPGGRLLCTDILYHDAPSQCCLMTWVYNTFANRRSFFMPESNKTTIAELEVQIKSIGFENVCVEDVTANTFTPFFENLTLPMLRNSAIRYVWETVIRYLYVGATNGYRYCVITAEKPAVDVATETKVSNARSTC